MKKQMLNLALFVCIALMLASFFVIAAPNGASVTPGTSQRQNATSAGQDTGAIAGNVTELTVTGTSITQSWQGYYGNVSGVIQLADISDNILYNWSLTTPEGEIYASNASTVRWSTIQCYDATNNLTFFENMFGIGATDDDGIDVTFALNNHAEFYTNSVQFTAGQCDNAQLYNSLGVGTFDEALLTDGNNIVFASLLLDNANGFDNVPHDFEMIVLEDGHGVDTSASTYYFWVELE